MRRAREPKGRTPAGWRADATDGPPLAEGLTPAGRRPASDEPWTARSEPMTMADPGATGRFGEFGGQFIPESLMPACLELEAAFRSAWSDPAFRREYDDLLRDYGGR